MKRPTGKIHYAKLENSKRLQRLLSFLSSGREYTTIQIMQQASIAAVSAAVCELRENNILINCRLLSYDQKEGTRTYGYQLTEFAAAA
jgi:hypothetical protein